MSHALVRTNATGHPFRGRCVKCGAEDLRMSASLDECPHDDLEGDAAALARILDGKVTH